MIPRQLRRRIVRGTSRDRVRGALARRFGIDPRALAAFRIGLGLVLLVDLGLRSRHLVAFYTDAGVLPRSTLYELYPAARYSLHALSGAAWAQAALFLVGGIAAVALLVGHRTTFATVASLLLLTSLHVRNPFVLNGGDVLLRRLLFWGVFLPLGRRWSVDAVEDRGADRVETIAEAALLLQVVLVYTVTGLFKLRGSVWTSGVELQYLFNIDQLTVGLAPLLVGYPGLLRALTWLWLGLVLTSALLVLSTGWVRVLLVGLFAAFHVGMLLTMQIGVFPGISLVALIPFVPGRIWDSLEGTLPAASGWWPATALGRLTGGWDAITPDGGLEIDILSPEVRTVASDVLPYAVAVLLLGSLTWNAMGLGYVATPDRLAAVRDPTEHRWDMFARGQRDDGWFVAPGTLESGDRVDAYAREPVRWERPPDLAATYPSARWLRYSLALRGIERLQHPFAGYLCSRWNREHADELTRVTVVYNKVHVGLDGPEHTERVELVEHACR